jgi:hypothetical protein
MTGVKKSHGTTARRKEKAASGSGDEACDPERAHRTPPGD